jgi:hypothetical protein
MATGFIYGVLRIPPVSSLTNSYFGQCYVATPGDETESTPCSSPAAYYYAYQQKTLTNDSYCTSIAYGNDGGANPSNPDDGMDSVCSNWPLNNPNQPASATNGGISVYTFMGGNPQIPSPANYTSIPSVGGNYPVDMGPELWLTEPNVHYFAWGTIESMQGVPPPGNSTGPYAPGGFIILAYRLEWINSWADLDLFAPNSLTGNTTSPFLNQSSQGNNSPLGDNCYPPCTGSTVCKGDTCIAAADVKNFYFAAPGPSAGNQVPNLEDQWFTIMQYWCQKQSNGNAACQNINGGNFCSNMLAIRSDGTNYCRDLYNVVDKPGQTENIIPCDATGNCPTGSGLTCVNNVCIVPCSNGACENPLETCINGACVATDLETSTIAGAIENYCAGFGTETVPDDCQCQSAQYTPQYKQIQQIFDTLGGKQIETFGNVSCWFQPCQNAQTTLIPPTDIGVQCPNVCQEIQTYIASNGGQIDINGAKILQNMQCCIPNAAGSNSQNANNPCQLPSTSSKCTGTGQGTCASGQVCMNGSCETETSCTGTGQGTCAAGQSCIDNICQTPETFWEKYKTFIIIAIIIIILVIILFIVYLIFKK